MSRSTAPTPPASERLALKDSHLVYRGCTRSFARSVGHLSPDDVVGSTDFSLLPRKLAREQLVLDSRVMHTGRVDVGTIQLDAQRRPMLIVRLPVLSYDRRVQGIDIRLIEDPENTEAIASLMALMEGDMQTRSTGSVGGFIPARPPSRPSVASGPKAAAGQGPSDGAGSGLASAVASEIASGAAFEASPGAASGADLRTDSRTASGTDTREYDASSLLQLRLQGLRFRHFAESSADFFWELDAQLRFSYVSPSFSSVFDMPRTDILGCRHDTLLADPRRADGEYFWQDHLKRIAGHVAFRDFEFRWAGNSGIKSIRYSGMPIFNRAGAFLGYRGTGSDVTALVKQAETTAYHASHDALTGLYNRRHFEQVVKDTWRAAKASRATHAVCFMDMDNFKIVNDTCGHQAGDELLRQLAQLFGSLVRQSDVLARIGGDEFGLMLRDCSVGEALKLANQVRHEVETFQFLWQENRFTVGVSIGLVVLDDRWESCEVLFRAADSACYLAKNEGRNRVVVHREADGHSRNRRAATQWVDEIGKALTGNRLRLAYQTIKPLHENLPGQRLEMLLRLQMPNGELVSPTVFLPSAERYGLSAALDERAVDLTLAFLDSNPGLVSDLVTCSVNLASGSFADSDFAHRLVNKIDRSDIDPCKLSFDFTETATIANLSSAASFMHILSALGCKFCIDSFGSGLSSFSYLRKLPVECLKIDGLLIKDILDDETQYTLVRAICDISRSMGKGTVAGHVDSPELMEAVRRIGIDFAQGFHVSEPRLVQSA